MVKKKTGHYYLYVSPVFSFLLRFRYSRWYSRLLALIFSAYVTHSSSIDPSLYIYPYSRIVLIIHVKPAIIIIIIINSSHVREL
jgi:hypothetical protein